jgi:hypothetical protein
MKPVYKTVLWLTVFSIAMGFLETAVVVYLRELMYKGGFAFPVQPASRLVLLTELCRELATIIMLLGIAVLSGKTFAQRFVFFLYSFAIWDLCYYLFLKVLLNWPITLFNWDILFLLPVPWVGPVLAPCIISCSMILLMCLVLYLETKAESIRFDRWVWLGFISGSLVLIYSFCMDYVSILNHADIGKEDMLSVMKSFIPRTYHWEIFWIGELLILYGVFRLWFRNSHVVPAGLPGMKNEE